MTSGGGFHTTRWSVVLSAGGAGEPDAPPEAAEALERLASAYWFPLYAYARRRGADREAARDQTQGFFALLLERRDLAAAAPERGRFRSFLLTAFQHFLVNEAERARALKRGGGQAPLSFDAGEAESRLAVEPEDAETPERVFEREWGRAVLARTLDRLRADYAARGKERIFEALQPHLVAAERGTPYAEVAAALDASEGAVKVAVHRLRQAYRHALRREVGETLSDPSEIEDELARLRDALA